MLLLVTAMVLQSLASPKSDLTRAEVSQWTAEQAAVRLLPASVSLTIIDGQVWRGPAAGFFGALWWTMPSPSETGLCRRLAYRATISPTDLRDTAPTATLVANVEPVVQYAAVYPEAANPERCADRSGWISTSSEDETTTVESLHRLVDAITKAAGSEPIRFAVTVVCDPQTLGPCPEAQAALRDLPLDNLMHVGRIRQARPGLPPLILSGVEARLGPGGPSPDSWRVTLQSEHGVETVALRRSRIIYH